MSTLIERIEKGEFEECRNWDFSGKRCPYDENKKDYIRKQSEEYRKESNKMVELFKQSLFEELGIEDNPKKEALWEIAWERGHSDGYREVLTEAEVLVELIKDVCL